MAESPHIAFFLPSLQMGGVERVMLNVAEGMISKASQVDMVLSKAEGEFLACLPKGLRVVDLKATRVIASLGSLVKYLQREQPDVLFVGQSHANLVALWAKFLGRTPTKIIICIHSLTTVEVARSPRWRDRLIPSLCALFYGWADDFIAVSQAAAADVAQLTGLSGDRIRVIYNPIVTSELYNQAKEPLEHPWFIDGEPPVILAVGRLTEAKDYPTLIRAFAALSRTQLARLLILGEGESRPELETLVKELKLNSTVSLPGFASNPYTYMARAALFVLSSQWEALPSVLIEAMACGTPIVCTNCPGGTAEILDSSCHSGELVPVGDAIALATAMQATLQNPPATDSLKQRASNFSQEKILNQYWQVVQIHAS